jgi:hypothetical protein
MVFFEFRLKCACELLSNKRIGIVIPFHHLLFSGIAIHFSNEMVIPQTKQGLKKFVIDEEYTKYIYIYIYIYIYKL